MGWRVDSLTPLTGEPRTREFIAIDTEDDQRGYGEGSGFYLGTVHTPKGSYSFDNRSRMVSFLDRPQWAGYWCAALNLEYDALNLWGARGVTQMTPTFSGSRLCGLKQRVAGGGRERGPLVFFDVGCFLAGSLASLARLVNSEKLDMRHRRGDRRVTRQRRDYCARDAEITWKLAHFIQDGVNALGAEMKLTAAATALDAFRRRYLHCRLRCLDRDIQEWLYRGYFGGRVECFRLGDFRGREFHKNDVNGAYVSVMIDQSFPDLGGLKERPGRSLDLSQEGMAECWLTVPSSLWAGPLPSRLNKLVFPVGRLLGRWTHSELRLALRYGVKLERVGRVYQTPLCHPYLREMMQTLRAIREKPATPPAVGRMAKLLGNSLYGKFAQRHEEISYLDMDDFLRGLRAGRIRPGRDYALGGARIYESARVVRLITGVKVPKHSNVIWSAIITAGCRGLLYPHLDRATTFYCDTDSVIGLKAYPRTRKLGELAGQGSYRRLVIRGNKLYAGREAEGWEAHAKGFPEDKALAAVRCRSMRLTSRRPIKLRSALAGRGPANRWVKVFKELRAVYDKRLVLPGGETAPLKVRQW